MDSTTIGRISRKFANRFIDGESDVKNLIISSMIDTIKPIRKDIYFQCCKILVDILNYYISTQDKSVRFFQEGSYSVLAETDYGWKHIEIRRESYEDSKYLINRLPSFPTYLFYDIQEPDEMVKIVNLYNEFNTININRGFLFHSINNFFYDYIEKDTMSVDYDNGFCIFGDIKNLNFDLARECLIKFLMSNPYPINLVEANKEVEYFYRSIKFNKNKFEEQASALIGHGDDYKEEYENFIKKRRPLVFNYEPLFMPVDTYAHVENLLLSIDTDIEEIPLDVLSNNERHSVGIIGYVLKELGAEDINDYSVLLSVRKYHSLVESISRLLGNDFKNKRDILITALKSYPFSDEHYDVDNFQYNAIKEIVSNKSYNILDTEFLPISIPILSYKGAQNLVNSKKLNFSNAIQYPVGEILRIPNKARLKKAKNIDIKLNLLLDTQDTKIEL